MLLHAGFSLLHAMFGNRLTAKWPAYRLLRAAGVCLIELVSMEADQNAGRGTMVILFGARFSGRVVVLALSILFCASLVLAVASASLNPLALFALLPAGHLWNIVALSWNGYANATQMLKVRVKALVLHFTTCIIIATSSLATILSHPVTGPRDTTSLVTQLDTEIPIVVAHGNSPSVQVAVVRPHQVSLKTYCGERTKGPRRSECCGNPTESAGHLRRANPPFLASRAGFRWLTFVHYSYRIRQANHGPTLWRREHEPSNARSPSRSDRREQNTARCLAHLGRTARRAS